MQQILSFIVKNSYRLLFYFLLINAVLMVFKSHSYHTSEYVNSANFLSGAVYTQINKVEDYFKLKEKNKELAQENAYLKNILFNKKDTLLAKKISITNDVKYQVILSKVVRNSYSVRENYLTINTGKKNGIKEDMGVVNDNGIVGIVEKTSKNYATIQSILNTKSKINAKIKNSNHFGSLVWDGKNVGYAQLIDVPRLATIKKGDSIVTGGISEIFPENIPIGKIDKIFLDKQRNIYTINVRLFNDMTSLGYVYVIENMAKEEKIELEKATIENIK